MKSVLRKFLHTNIDKVLGIDVGSGALKLTEISYVPQPVLTNYLVMEYEQSIQPEEEQAVSLLAEWLRLGISRGGFTAKHAVFAVPGRVTFMREVDFPVMTHEELTEAVRWDIEKYVPYQPGTYYYDFTVIGQQADGLHSKVLLTAAPKSSVEWLVNISKQTGLKALAVEIEPIALSRTIANVKNSLMVDIGENLSQLTLFQAGCPVVSRTIPNGGKYFTKMVADVLKLGYAEAEIYKRKGYGLQHSVEAVGCPAGLDPRLRAFVDEIAKEIRRTMEYYLLQHKEAVIENILLTGGGSAITNLAEQLTVQLEEEVRLHNPLEIIVAAPSFDKAYLQKQSRRIAVALGLALRGGAYD